MSYSYEDDTLNNPDAVPKPTTIAAAAAAASAAAASSSSSSSSRPRSKRSAGYELSNALEGQAASHVTAATETVEPRKSARHTSRALTAGAQAQTTRTSIDGFEAAAAAQGLSSQREAGKPDVDCGCRPPAKLYLSTEAVERSLSGYRSLVAPVAPFAFSGIVAACSENNRYIRLPAARTGGLKYQPVGCSGILDEGACDELRRRRCGGQNRSFHFHTVLSPACEDYTLKMMVVPSIDCPEDLMDEAFCKKLLWAVGARKRPTFLFVHESEIAAYLTFVAPMMSALGAGIVAWRDDTPGIGFGLTRLAAQAFGRRLGRRSEIVMCDVNVVEREHVPKKNQQIKTKPLSTNGYGTDEERAERQKLEADGKVFALASGYGTGITRLLYTGPEVPLQRIKNDHAGSADERPLEQVVTVSEDVDYDPSFITSSEDRDFEKQLHAIGISTAKRDFEIFKVGFTGASLSQNAYRAKRKQYLASLAWEQGIRITYQGSETTVGALANKFATEFHLHADELASLIVEQILLRHKWG